MKKLFITKQIPEAALQVLKSYDFDIHIHSGDNIRSTEELIEHCLQYHAVLTASTHVLDKDFFTRCAHLKGVALTSVGYDNVDIRSATRVGVPVSNTPGVLSNATADIGLLLMLSVSRKAFYMHRAIVEGQWEANQLSGKLGIELYGKTLGIFGLGRIGLELARKCRALFQMKIIYHNRNRKTEAERELDAQYVSFEDLLQNSDVLSVHANLSDATRGIFSLEAFSQMKPGAIFINTSRGPLHNETDLITALNNKLIWGAGLDVTHPEPMKADNPLLQMENVCILPHLGSATIETRTKMAVMAAENIAAALNDHPMPQAINPQVYTRI